MYKGNVCAPKYQKMKILVLREMHNIPYVGHLGYQNTIAVVKGQHFWQE
jgi:hypothetical protein